MSDILNLIDNAIEAHEVSSDAMRWTPEWVKDEVDPVTGLRMGGIVHGGGWYMVDERHCWTPEMTRRAEQLISQALGAELTEWQRQVLRTTSPRMRPLRRAWLNGAVPSDLSRETDPASTERGTT